MSNNYQDYDDDVEFEDYDDEQPQRPNKNDVVQKLRRAERAKDKQLKELQAELESLRKFQRESVVERVLQEKGINPKVAKFIPVEIESSADSIGSWLEEYGDLFGGVSAPQSSNAANDADIAALRQMDAVTSGALNPDDINDAFSNINNAQSAEELLNFLYSQGAE